MTWLEKYGQDEQPTYEQMSAYIQNPLWEDILSYLGTAYDTQPKQSFSGCSAQPGWNVKFLKGGKSLCTLYPMEGYFIALVVVGQKESNEAELMMPSCTPYIQDLYEHAGLLMGARWLMIRVTDEEIQSDLKRLIALRRKPK